MRGAAAGRGRRVRRHGAEFIPAPRRRIEGGRLSSQAQFPRRSGVGEPVAEFILLPLLT